VAKGITPLKKGEKGIWTYFPVDEKKGVMEASMRI